MSVPLFVRLLSLCISLTVISLFWISPLSNAGLQESNAQVTSNSTASNNYLTYEKNGMKIKYPTEWTISENVFPSHSGENIPTVTFDSNSNAAKYSADVTVSIIPIRSLTPDEVFGKAIDDDKGLGKHFNLISSEPFDIKGNPAYKLSFTYNDKSFGPLHENEVIVINGNKSYDIEYTAQPDEFLIFLPTSQNIISSFELTNSSNVGTTEPLSSQPLQHQQLNSSQQSLPPPSSSPQQSVQSSVPFL